ncbi:MAG: site-specific integrase [Acidobacteriia bacterium]|nr:site-specific integrase [Terriglobia bacterium]
MKIHTSTIKLGSLLQQFFTERLMQQRHASPCTIAAYRDCFRLLLVFAELRLSKRPANMILQDLSPNFVLEFLDHLEKERYNSIRSRNARFAAIRAFLHYAAAKEPSVLAITQSVLAIPMKRFERPLVGFFSREQVQAILDAPDPDTWSGRRDRVMFSTLYNTGARVSELIHLRIADVSLESSPAVHILGKGRKERHVPLWSSTAKQIKRWLKEGKPRGPEQPLFPNRKNGSLTRTSVAERLQLAVQKAATNYPELSHRRISPHLFRHSVAMHLLQAGVDITVIALWLGHESTATTHMYVEADLAMKERALKSLQAPQSRSTRYRPRDPVLQFLQGL